MSKLIDNMAEEICETANSCIKGNMKKITKEQVMFWVGNDGYGQEQVADMSETICLITNGKYSHDQLREDILSSWDEEVT